MANTSRNRFTIYDVMDANGVFERNPANASARSQDGAALYQGPVQYPKMLYHPEGAERVTVPAEIIMTPMGPKAVGEQRELVWQIVQNAEEEDKLVKEGWHRHPAGSLRAAGKDAPATGADQRIAELERQLQQLQAERAALVGVKTAPPAVVNPLSKGH